MRHTIGDLESQKQVYCGYGVKNRRTRAPATINPHHPPKKKITVNKAKKVQEEGKERARTHSSEVLQRLWTVHLLKHPLAHSRTQTKNNKKREKYTKTAKREPEPAHLTSYCCKRMDFSTGEKGAKEKNYIMLLYSSRQWLSV